jgi:hypothetical protein
MTRQDYLYTMKAEKNMIGTQVTHWASLGTPLPNFTENGEK